MQEKKIERIFRTTIATLCALFMGVIFAALLLQEEPWFKKMLQEQVVIALQEYTGPQVSLEVQTVNLLMGEIVVKDFQACAEDASWKIKNDTFVIKFSLFDLLFKKTFHAQFIVHGLHISTELHGTDLAIAKPIALFLGAPSVFPFKLKGLALRASSLEVVDLERHATAQIHFAADAFMRQDVLKNTFFIQSGSLAIHEKLRLDRLQGMLRLELPTTIRNYKIQTHLSLQLPDLPEKIRAYNMHFSYDKLGELSLYSHDKALGLYAQNIDFSHTISALYQGHIDAGTFGQTGSIDINGTIGATHDGFKAHSEILSNELSVLSGIKNIDIQCDKQKQNYEVLIAVNKTPMIAISGNEVANTSNTNYPNALLKIEWKTLSEMIFSENYSLNRCAGEALFLSDNSLHGLLHGAYTDTTKKLQDLNGTFSYADMQGLLDLAVGHCNTKFLFDISKKQYDLETIDESGQPLLSFHYDAQIEKIAGTITIAPVKKLLKHLFSTELQGEGVLVIDGTVQGKDIYFTTHLANGTIKIPHVYNTIKQLDGSWTINLTDRKIAVHALEILLHTGQVDISEGICILDDTFSLSYASIPVQIQSCLGNWQKIFFGLASGYLIFSHNADNSSLSGTIIIDKSHVKFTDVSSDHQNTSVIETMRSIVQKEKPINLDIQVLTRSLVKIKTSFIETEARGKIRIKGTLGDPLVTGKVSLHEGLLAFPYKPLYIQQAKIYLNPDQLSDSFIELVAKNTIKKFAIQMEVSGSLQSPHIALSSSPLLHEEQILTLLLAGSQDGSLFGVMPHMLMQGVEKMLFSTEHSSDWLQSLKNVLKPLGNIRIKPAIFDKQNKPVKGGFEIDINDSLTASIANNLDLTDEPSVEVEYALTDATTVRGTRDDKGNISGEIEVRWKF